MNRKYYVYFIQSGRRGPIKIGIAKNIQRRLEALQTANPFELRLLSAVPCNGRKDAEDLEKHFHHLFRRKHIRGEWFMGNIRLNALRDEQIPVYTENEGREMEIALEARRRQ